MKFKLIIFMVLVVTLAVFSFWPSFLSAHYAGTISCPIVMGDMSGCQNMAAHMNNILAHISGFMVMIASMITGTVFLSLVLMVIAMIDFAKINALRKRDQSTFILKIYNFIGFNIKTKTLIFQGLERGILNTKVF